MGAVHGVDVGNGAGVRSTASTYDDSGWFTSPGATGVDSADLAVDKIALLEVILAGAVPFDVGELAAATLAQLRLVTVGDLIGSTADYSFVLLEETLIQGEADCALLVEPSLTRDDRTVPSRNASFTVPAYIVDAGRPVATTGLVCDVAVECGVGAFVELETAPEPRNVAINATARWLPQPGTLVAGGTEWYTYSQYLTDPSDGFSVGELAAAFNLEQIRLYRVDDLLANGNLIVRPSSATKMSSTTGAAPIYSPSYTYYRAGGRVRSGAVSMDRGSYLWTDDIAWSSQEVTIIAVVVLREPTDGWYGILETTGPMAGTLGDYFGLRFSSDGTLALHADGVLAAVDLVTGQARPAQPVVVGFNVDMASQEITLLAIDDKVTMVRTVLPQRVDANSRLYLGRSPLGQNAAANMDVLEFAYFSQSFGSGDLAQLLARYDQMYGVTTS